MEVQVGYSDCLHIITVDTKGVFHSSLFRVVSKLNLASNPSNWPLRFLLAARMLEDFLPFVFIQLSPAEKVTIKVRIIGDNQDVQHNFITPSKEEILQKAISKATALCHVLNETNHIPIYLGYVDVNDAGNVDQVYPNSGELSDP